MIPIPSDPNELDHILMGFLAENDEPTPEALSAWVTRYPQYKNELAEFAVVWLMQILPRSPNAPVTEISEIVEKAMAAAPRVDQQTDIPTPQKSLEPFPDDSSDIQKDDSQSKTDHLWWIETSANSDYHIYTDISFRGKIKGVINHVIQGETIPDDLYLVLPSLLIFLDEYNKSNQDPLVERMVNGLNSYIKKFRGNQIPSNKSHHYFDDIPGNVELGEADGQYVIDLVHELMR
jgi:hypothetical protein